MDRLINYASLSNTLARLTDEELVTLVAKAPSLHSGVGGRSVVLTIDSTPIFVKRVPLTDLERRPEHATRILAPPWLQTEQSARRRARRSPHRRFSSVRSFAISASFFARVQRLICLSRFKAVSHVAHASEYAKTTGLRLAVKPDALPSLCFKRRTSKSPVSPT